MSLSTLDRRITAGLLTVRREPHGGRHRIYVVVDDDIFETSGANNATEVVGPCNTQLAVARERIRGLEAQLALLREQLRWEQDRNVELFGRLKEAKASQPIKKERYAWWNCWGRRRNRAHLAVDSVPE